MTVPKVLDVEFYLTSLSKFNGISNERVVGKCGPLEEVNMPTYAIASGKNVIFIGLKGLTPAFDHNYEIFLQSLKTMKIDHQSDIKKLISKSYPPD